MTDLPHRQLVTQLEADRAAKLASLDAITDPDLYLVASTYASAYLHAITHTLAIFEGADAAQRYVREHADGRHAVAHEGPTVAEVAADDRAYWTTRYDH